MTDKATKQARDVQKRTHWGYQFCRYIVGALGYDEVSKAIDTNTGCMMALGDELNVRARGRKLTMKRPP